MADQADEPAARPPGAILFDLDGTLDDRPLSIARYAVPFRSSFAERLAELELAELAAALQRADGDGYRLRETVCAELLQALPWRSLPDLPRLVEHWYEWFPLSTAPREGLIEVLQMLASRGIKLGVVTNGGVRIQQAKLTALGVEPYLSAVVISEAAGIAKPDAAIFRLALAQLGCEPGEAWFVGDHPVNDVLGASAAGLRGIWLPTLHPWPAGQPEPWRTISALPDVLPLIGGESGHLAADGPARSRPFS